MAKKQSLSYSPNMGLIAGEAAVAGSEAARTSLGGQAFTQNLSASVISMIDEEKKRKAEMQGWMTDLGSVDNINKLDQNYNKQAVTDFVRSGRDEFAKLAAIYKKTGNLDVMDKMNDIKYSFQNLNNQLENLQQDRKTYIDQFNKGKIVTIKGDEKYTDIYTNKGQFKIEKNGDIGFSHGENGSVYSKFNDIAGKWNPDNSIYGKEFLTTDSQEVARAQKGDQFDARGVRNRLGGLLNQQSWQEVQVAFMQDIIGDDEMELEDGRTAGNMSFQALWSTGQLDKKFYEGFKAESNGTYNTDWMFEKENRSLGTKLKAMYDTDVIESRHKDMFKAKPSDTDSDEGDDDKKYKYGGFLYGKNETGGDSEHPNEDQRESFNNIGYLKQVVNRNNLLSLDLNDPSTYSFKGFHYDYKYNKDEGSWQAFYDNKFVKNLSGGKIAKIEGLLSAKDIDNGDSYSMFDVDSSTAKNKREEKRLAAPKGGGVGLGNIEILISDDVDARKQVKLIRKQLHSVFSDDFKDKYEIFAVTKRSGYTGGMTGSGSNTLVVPNIIRIRSKDGTFNKTYKVGKDATSDIANELTKEFELYIRQSNEDNTFSDKKN